MLVDAGGSGWIGKVVERFAPLCDWPVAEDGGMALLGVSRQLGHGSSMITSAVYSHALPDREVERRNQFSGLYAARG